MKRQGGFTLIELVVVIVILGILAVTAAPKFMNLQNDARKASLQGLKGSIEGAAGIVYGKAAIKGVEASENPVTVDSVSTVYGYPAATSAGIQAAVNGLGTDSKDWECKSTTSGNTPALQCTFKGKTSYFANDASGNCYVEYTQATSGAVATTTVVATGDACKTN